MQRGIVISPCTGGRGLSLRFECDSKIVAKAHGGRRNLAHSFAYACLIPLTIVIVMLTGCTGRNEGESFTSNPPWLLRADIDSVDFFGKRVFTFVKKDSRWEVCPQEDGFGKRYFRKMSDDVAAFCGTNEAITKVLARKMTQPPVPDYVSVRTNGAVCVVEYGGYSGLYVATRLNGVYDYSLLLPRKPCDYALGEEFVVAFEKLWFMYDPSGWDHVPTPGIRMHRKQVNNSGKLCSKGSGVHVYDINRKQDVHLTRKTGLPSDDVTCVCVSNNVVWIGDFKGYVTSYETEGGEMETFRVPGRREPVTCIEWDGRRVYVGTMTKALMVYDSDDETWDNVTISENRADMRIDLMTLDGALLWGSTERNFFSVDCATLNVSNIFDFVGAVDTNTPNEHLSGGSEGKQ